jgi:hypothetical protein
LSERAWKLRLLEQCSRSREENADFAASDSLERLDSLARDLGVRLDFAEAFPRRIKRNGTGLDQRFEISEPSLGARDAFRDYDEKPSLTGVRHGSDGECVAGTWKPRYV